MFLNQDTNQNGTTRILQTFVSTYYIPVCSTILHVYVVVSRVGWVCLTKVLKTNFILQACAVFKQEWQSKSIPHEYMCIYRTKP